MKAHQFETLYRKYLLTELPGFAYSRRLLFARPILYLLRGFCFEPSGFDRSSFYVWVFIQPLYVPRDHVVLNLGERLSGRDGQGWVYNRENEVPMMADVLASVKERGLSFLGKVQTPQDLALKAPLVNGRLDHPYTAEAIAYSFVLSQQYPEALQALDHLDTISRTHLPTAPYLAETLDRSQQVRQRLERDPQEAIELLDQWTEKTRSHLRLPKDTLA